MTTWKGQAVLALVVGASCGLSACGAKAERDVKDRQAFVIIDAGEDADRAWGLLSEVNARLSPQARASVASQGHFDATNRIAIELVGSCASRDPVVREVRRLGVAAGARDVRCMAELPTRGDEGG